MSESADRLSSDLPQKADQATVEYFDSHQHKYSHARIKGVAKLVRPLLGPDARLADVGCGTGDNLHKLSQELGINEVTAMDVSAASLAHAAELMPHAEIAQVSLLDEVQLRPWAGQFDAVVIAAVLHHLVGKTRRSSRSDAELGLRNALTLLKPGGLLIILEPVFTPRAMVAGLFWLKRLVTSVTTERVPVFGYWNNIGAPVVSFYSLDQVREMATAAGAVVDTERSERKSLGYADRLVSKADATIIARRIES